MENISSASNSKKRARDESGFNSPELYRVESDNSGSNPPESKQIREDLLDILVDADPAIQDLDLVIQNFEYEILNQSEPEPEITDWSLNSGESQPEFGYLFKASDDELGLPPTMSVSDDQKNSESINLGPTMPHLGFEDDLPSYDSFGFGIVGETEWNGDVNSEFVTLGGLFDDSDGLYFSDFWLRPELAYSIEEENTKSI